LSRVKFLVDEQGMRQSRKGPTDEELLRKRLSTFEREVRRRWLRQGIFPVKIAQIKYFEFRLFNNKDMAAELADDGEKKSYQTTLHGPRANGDSTVPRQNGHSPPKAKRKTLRIFYHLKG